MKTAHVKMAEGITVFRQPEDGYAPLPVKGREVFLTPYYLRALREGDLVEFTPEQPPADEPTAVDTPHETSET